MDNLIVKLYQLAKTVLTSADIALVWGETDSTRLKAKISYYVKTGALIRLTRGVFIKNKNYNPKELATSIYTPSYISFETVLREAGVIFQYYETIFVASKWPRVIKIDNRAFTFRKLKDEILFNPAGTIFKDNYWAATTERAFLDMIYLFPNYYFDNLSVINWEKCFELAPLYKNQQIIKRLNKYFKQYAQ